MAVLWPRLVEPWAMLQMRLWWLLLTAAMVAGGTWVNRQWGPVTQEAHPAPTQPKLRRVHCWRRLTHLARTGAQLVWLLHWYPDIWQFNRSFPNLDHLFAAADQWLFGCQPSVTFSQWLSGGLWSELFNLGYWSYFPMIATLVLAVWWKDITSSTTHLREVSAVILTSFFIFYLIFLLLPVAGPQFYFKAVGVDQILAGHFPPVGTWFSSHTDMLPAPGNAHGVFYQLVASSQQSGERPIAAFPSSHVGLSTIVLLLSRRHVPRLTKYLLPFWLLLCCATVYIQAHYLVDAIAGLLMAPPVCYIATHLVRKI